MSARPSRATAAGMVGVLNVLKPPGMTSHDVVDHVRGVSGIRKVGHAGTLDPGACGVLVLCLGAATRIVEFLTEGSKGYRCEFTFGLETDSGDAYGAAIREVDASGLTGGDVETALREFVGEQDQVPPMVSAVQKGGRRLYELARQGETVEIAPRRITISECRVMQFAPGPRPVALIHVECSKGTYVRVLARDLGARLGCGGHASFVLRTRVGAFGLTDSLTLEELDATAAEGRLPEALRSMDDALGDLAVVDLTGSQRYQVLEGRPIPLFGVPGWAQLPVDRPIRLRDEFGLVALARIVEGRLRPFRVLREPRGS